jgi:hypothetical protein
LTTAGGGFSSAGGAGGRPQPSGRQASKIKDQERRRLAGWLFVAMVQLLSAGGGGLPLKL